MSEWQPIETAPKDGRMILIRQGQWLPCHARWVHGRWSVVEYNGTHYPTHWAPLPGLTEQKVKKLVGERSVSPVTTVATGPLESLFENKVIIV